MQPFVEYDQRGRFRVLLEADGRTHRGEWADPGNVATLTVNGGHFIALDAPHGSVRENVVMGAVAYRTKIRRPTPVIAHAKATIKILEAVG